MNREPQLSAATWLTSILATCVILLLFQKILWLVVPGLLALVLYYSLRPLVQSLVRAGLRHRAAALAVAGLLFFATILILFFLFPVATTRAAAWKESMVHYLQGGLDFITKTENILAEKVPGLRGSPLLKPPPMKIDTVLEQVGERYLGTLLLQIVHWLPSLLLTPYLTYFFLRDGNRLKKHLIRSVPNAYFEKTLLLFDRIDRSLQSFFVGLIRLTFLDTISLALGLWFFGVSSPLLLGLIAAVLAWLPYIGSALGCILVVLMTSADFPDQPGITYACILLFLGVRILDDFLFLPMTIGRSLHIHPVLSVLMLFLGAAVAGPTGLLLVLPVLGVVTVITEIMVQILTDRCLRERFRLARQLKASRPSPS